jgi:tetratricopeptide (TPR) repeat protein
VPAARSTYETRVAFLEGRAQADPLDVFALNELAAEHMQRARETGDVSALTRADQALTQSLDRQPDDNYEALALSASLAVTQHDFARGLALAEQAIALKPRAAYAYGALGDAHMGLGRYEDAAASYATMHELEPWLSSHSRLALLAQTEGRHEDAHAHWREALAIAQQSETPEHQAWVRAQIANLSFQQGDLDGAAAEYAASLDALPGYVHALAGLGRVSAARGDLEGAIAHYSAALEVVPLPEYTIALGDSYEASGDEQAARDQYEVVTAIEQLYAANGVNLDLQVALFNADHERDLESTVAKARALYAEQPNIAAADALAWSLYQHGDIAGARDAMAAALRTGVREPSILFHAGMIYHAAGDADLAAEYLQAVQDANPQFSVRHAETARRALEEVRLEASR